MTPRVRNFRRPFFLLGAAVCFPLVPACDDSAQSSGKTNITINGKSVHTSGSRIQIRGNSVTVNGKTLSGAAVQGSGTVKTETRDLPDFTAVELHTGADISIRAGEKHRCTITADENLFPLILTEIADQTLRISPRESYSGTQTVAIFIETPALQKVSLAGSGSIALHDVSGESLELELSGAGSITADGKSKNLRATISGAGDIRAQNLQTQNSVVRIQGVGNAEVWTENELSAEINGVGNIGYRGAATNVKTRVQGVGSASRRRSAE